MCIVDLEVKRMLSRLWLLVDGISCACKCCIKGRVMLRNYFSFGNREDGEQLEIGIQK